MRWNSVAAVARDARDAPAPLWSPRAVDATGRRARGIRAVVLRVPATRAAVHRAAAARSTVACSVDACDPVAGVAAAVAAVAGRHPVVAVRRAPGGRPPAMVVRRAPVGLLRAADRTRLLRVGRARAHRSVATVRSTPVTASVASVRLTPFPATRASTRRPKAWAATVTACRRPRCPTADRSS